MRKKLLIGITLVAFVCISFSLSYINSNEKLDYNSNPNLESKVIGSEAIRNHLWLLPVNSIEDLVKFSDLIVIGEVVSDGLTTTEGWPEVEGDKKGETDLSQRPPVTVTHTKIRINKTLYGESNSNTITLLQLGMAGDNRGETKVKKNQKMIFILRNSNDGRDLYSSVRYEDGFFEIKNNNKIMSLSKELAIAKYDNTDVALLKKDILKAVKKKEDKENL